MFFGPHKMKMSQILFSLWYPLELGTILIYEDPSPNFELFPNFPAFYFGKLPLGNPYANRSENYKMPKVRGQKEVKKFDAVFEKISLYKQPFDAQIAEK